MARAIGTLGTIDTVTAGGRVMTDITDLKILLCAGDTANSNATPQSGNGGNYQIPGGKSFKITAIELALYTSSASKSSVNVGYADNATGYIGTGTAFTNLVGAYGTSTNEHLTMDAGTSVLAVPFDFTVPAGKYIAITFSAANTTICRIYGYEV